MQGTGESNSLAENRRSAIAQHASTSIDTFAHRYNRAKNVLMLGGKLGHFLAVGLVERLICNAVKHSVMLVLSVNLLPRFKGWLKAAREILERQHAEPWKITRWKRLPHLVQVEPSRCSESIISISERKRRMIIFECTPLDITALDVLWPHDAAQESVLGCEWP